MLRHTTDGRKIEHRRVDGDLRRLTSSFLSHTESSVLLRFKSPMADFSGGSVSGEDPTNPTIGIEVVDCVRLLHVGLVLAGGTFPTRKPDIRLI
jgi:hypothetical protein